MRVLRNSVECTKLQLQTCTQANKGNPSNVRRFKNNNKISFREEHGIQYFIITTYNLIKTEELPMIIMRTLRKLRNL
jgi:hypothetical protein